MIKIRIALVLLFILAALCAALCSCSGEAGSDEGAARADDKPPASQEAESAPQKEAPELPAAVARFTAPFTGDLDQMRSERQIIRVLTVYSHTGYFVTKGEQKGIEYELLRQFDQELNKGRKAAERVALMFIALPFDELIDALLAGKGDVIAAGMTVTPEREKQVAFTKPYLPDISELVVASKDASELKSLDDLAGRTVHVTKGSSFAEHLRKLSDKLVAKGLKPIEVVEPDASLEQEEIMEMVNAGIFSLTVADSHVAELWEKVLPDIRVRRDLAVATGRDIAWAVRPGSVQLKEALDSFVGKARKGSLLGNVLFTRYFEETDWISNPVTKEKQAKLQEMQELFKKYAAMYGFDWLKIAAVAYQESGLDQSKKSSRGAVGVMQIKPSTAADKNVGVADVYELENNIHAGVKYMAFLRDRYFTDKVIPDAAKTDFTLAAYNAGPANVARFRKAAAELERDPNLWFFNVEYSAANLAGNETVTYVENINKYYLAYIFAMQNARMLQEIKNQAREQ